MVRRILGLAVPLVALAVVGTVVTLAQSGGSGLPRVAVLIPGPVRFFDVQMEAMEAEAERLGLEMRVFDAGWDAARQIAQITQAGELGFDLVAIAGVDSSVADAASELTARTSIPVVTFTNAIGPDPIRPSHGVVAHVGRDEAKAGRLLAEQVGAVGLRNARVLVIEGAPGTAPQRERNRGFTEVAASAGWTAVDTVPIEGWNLDVVEDTIAQRFDPATIDVIATQWADSALVVSNYLDSIDADPFPVVTLEWTASLVNAMDRGHIRSSTHFSIATEGKLAIQTAAAILEGDAVPQFVEVDQVVVGRDDASGYATEW